jgi:hypothetical protein
MTEMMSPGERTEDPNAVPGLDGLDEQLISQLVGRAKAGGLRLTGEGGMLQQLTKRLLESALDGEITDHLGYDKHDPAGRNTGNSRNDRAYSPDPLEDEALLRCARLASACRVRGRRRPRPSGLYHLKRGLRLLRGSECARVWLHHSARARDERPLAEQSEVFRQSAEPQMIACLSLLACTLSARTST